MVHAVQQTLIVDDSKTARLALSKMLSKHHIAVQMVESAEDALEFLQRNHPDVIFMDHMMPGMDGFAAVKAIKSDPLTAAIPIVMHTTKQGDIYLGQAKALGAVDILSKPATDQDLIAVLNRVQHAQEMRAARNSALGRTGSRPALSSDTMELNAHAVAMAANLLSGDESEIGSSRASTSRPRPDNYTLAGGTPSISMPVVDIATRDGDTAPFFGTYRQWLLALVWLIPIVWLLSLYLPTEKQMAAQARQQRQLLDALEWSINQRESYDFGAVPFSGELLPVLQGLVSRLTNAGFTGVIQLEGHIGEFCLTTVKMKDGTRIEILPEPDLPLTACSMIGYAPVQAERESVQQSEAFARYLRSSGLLADNAPIQVEILPMGSRHPKFAYPENLQGLTTGDWNSIALRNNRVHVVLSPR